MSPRVVRWMSTTQVVHAHFGPDATKIMRSAAVAGRPLVVTFHGYDITMPKVVAEYPYGELFRRASRIIAVSEHIRDKLLLAGAAPAKVEVAHIGIPLPPDRTLEAADADVLFVGRLIEKKGPDDLLRAAAKLRQQPRITIIGDGPLRRELEELAAQAGLDVRFLGAQPFTRVDMEMRRHRLLCAPSRPAANGNSEGLPIVVLEAAARRLPIVSYRSAGVDEAVQDDGTGLLAPEGDVAALAVLLERALGDSELRERLGGAGRARVEEQFDIDVCTNRVEEIYDKARADIRRPAVGRTYLGGRARVKASG